MNDLFEPAGHYAECFTCDNQVMMEGYYRYPNCLTALENKTPPPWCPKIERKMPRRSGGPRGRAYYDL